MSILCRHEWISALCQIAPDWKFIQNVIPHGPSCSISRGFGLASLHILHVGWSYRGSRALGTNFHFLSVFVVSEKKFIVQGEDKLKGSAQANLERNRQKLERKKIGRFRSGGEHSRTGGEHSPVRAHTSTRSRSWACRNHKTLTNLWRSKGLWRWVLLSNVRTVSLPFSVVARAWSYRLHQRHAPGLLLCVW